MIVAGGGLGAMWAPADSARAVATVYTVSLLATLPIAAAAVGALVLRRASAASRTAMLRAAVFALLIAYVARHLPMHWFAWTVPAPLAAPLVELGRIQVMSAPASAAGGGFSFADALAVAYWLGALLVIAPTVAASIVSRRRARRTNGLAGREHVLTAVARTLGVRRAVAVHVSSRAMVPATWGWLRPVVLLPAEAIGWSDDELRIVLTHELSHVRASDWICGVAARVMCALYWFHPGAWWIARRLEENAELACDERVIGAGIRRSDYAELLVRAASMLPAARAASALAFAGPRATGIRARLAVILDPAHVARPLARRWSRLSMAATIALAVPMSMVRLAPTRGVLTSLMRDARWESRAYAVLGLAQRPDTIAEARSAAERDPSPRVRAWARYALAEYGVTAPAGASRTTRP
ncbi:MAG TPA: M56 family metallopeptidase [Gemmatimonadaceae bacterium]|nr:M56 family metallopeptidase [Gemmatimonadaceae bacterium]